MRRPRGLAKKYIRVVVHSTDDYKLGVYEQGSKTYTRDGDALAAVGRHERKGLAVEVWETNTNWRRVR